MGGGCYLLYVMNTNQSSNLNGTLNVLTSLKHHQMVVIFDHYCASQVLKASHVCTCALLTSGIKSLVGE